MSNFSRRHFHDIDIKELIHQYKQYDCLWNFNSPDYKSKSTKQQAWLEISNYFQKDASEVKRKVKYLRSAYVAEKRKVDASRKSGTEIPYKPSLFYYNELDFLDNIVVLRKNSELDFESRNISPDTDDNEELVPFENRDDINLKVEKYAESEPEIELSRNLPFNDTPKILNSRSIVSRPVKRKVIGEIKQKNAAYTNTPNDRRKNLYISFGKTIALQLQELPLKIAVLAMSEIHAILTKKTLGHIKSLQKSHEQWSPSESDDSYNELSEEDFKD